MMRLRRIHWGYQERALVLIDDDHDEQALCHQAALATKKCLEPEFQLNLVESHPVPMPRAMTSVIAPTGIA